MGIFFSAQPLTTIICGALGAVAGLIIHVSASYFPDPFIDNPARQHLQQIKEESPDPIVLENIGKIENIFSTTIADINNPFELHDLYDRVTEITDEIKEQRHLRNIWRQFLQAAGNTKIRYPGGREQPLDFQRQIQRLDSNILPVYTERLFSHALPEEDLRELQQIYLECFGGNYFTSYSNFSRWLTNSCMIHLVAKDGEGKMIGWLAYRLENESQDLHLCYYGRKAEAAKMGVATRLFEKFLAEDVTNQNSVYLEVRRSNEHAIAFYERLGFQMQNTISNYYSLPREDGLVMSLPLHVGNYRAM
ncbi:MAG: hypothetical protein Tsb0015_02730 [Simkaniaceae bacterium]